MIGRYRYKYGVAIIRDRRLTIASVVDVSLALAAAQIVVLIVDEGLHLQSVLGSGDDRFVCVHGKKDVGPGRLVIAEKAVRSICGTR